MHWQRWGCPNDLIGEAAKLLAILSALVRVTTADFIVVGPLEVSSAATSFVARDALVRAPVPAMRTNTSAIRCRLDLKACAPKYQGSAGSSRDYATRPS